MRLITIDGNLEPGERYVYLVSNGRDMRTFTNRKDAERCAIANAGNSKQVHVYAMKAWYYWATIRDTRGEMGGGYWDFPTFVSSCHCRMIAP